MPPLEHSFSGAQWLAVVFNFLILPDGNVSSHRRNTAHQSNCNPQPTSAHSYVTRLQLKDPEDTGDVHTTWPENSDRRMALV